MAQVTTAGQLPAFNSLHFGGGDGCANVATTTTTTLKRKTPSELRGELLKRTNMMEIVDESMAAVAFSTRDTDVSVPKKLDSTKAPRYINTRLDDLYPARKASIRARLLPGKENVKENVKFENSLKSSMVLDAKHQEQNLRNNGFASKSGEHSKFESNNATEKGSCNTFRSFTELSLGGERSGSSVVDMDKALKGLISCELRSSSTLLAESSDKTRGIMSQSFSSEFNVPGQKLPLDLTLKTTMRVLCSSSVNWFHRLANCGSFSGMAQFTNIGCYSVKKSETCSSGATSTSQVTDSKTLHSWVHPQSTLPSSAISALTLSGGGGEMDFLSKRQQAWEESFRSLYYMLRKKFCNLFYVCTTQFVVMFTGSAVSEETKHSCYAYISQSTRNLRSLLKEQDISFLMPLCKSNVEEVTVEDLVELSEIEKYNLGQTRPIETVTGVDNTPQSLLVVSGNKNIHGLYDFMLNYRSFLSSLAGADVPVLCSPVPFENAALSAPEVSCRQLRRADQISAKLEPNMNDEISSNGISYGVEIKAAYLPPWVISGVCNAMLSTGTDFQASFVTESTSVGLNIGLETRKEAIQEVAADEPHEDNSEPFNIPNTLLSPEMHSAFLKGFKYYGGSFTASLSPI